MSLAKLKPVPEEPGDAGEAFAAFVADDASAQAANAVARQRGWDTGEVRHGDLSAALRQLGIVPPAAVTVVDLDDATATERTLSAVRDLAAATRLVTLGTHNDVELYRRVVDAGAADYLVKPVDAETLADAVARAEQQVSGTHAQAPAQRGRCIAVTGARGGAGTTTVAASLAWLIAETHARSVGLLDLDLQFGNMALSFDVEPGSGLREAVEDPERVDEIFIDRTAVSLGDHLDLLAAEESLDDVPAPGEHAVARLLATLRERYNVTLVDLPRALVAEQPDGLEQISDLVIVSDLSLVGLRDTNRLLRFLSHQPGVPQLHVVANRAGRGSKGQVAVTEFQRELETGLTRTVSFEPEVAAKAEMAGKPLPAAAAKSRAGRDLHRLMADLTAPAASRRRGLLARLLGG
ncbi:pilus assembly protein CpaE [Limimonas halophila]|uniref:Pilus assembly protein CpaE n=1 Tax=Limimonas halophila TaxID=1082479 RepID=A0A1G7PAE5_9PROT|nr:cellulose synthase operon protein YhjQ/BcsQ [Limimonas halophila]SDF83285.1 pilus assembly protein CpaE [Limimonas halophila]